MATPIMKDVAARAATARFVRKLEVLEVLPRPRRPVSSLRADMVL